MNTKAYKSLVQNLETGQAGGTSRSLFHVRMFTNREVFNHTVSVNRTKQLPNEQIYAVNGKIDSNVI